MTREEMINMLSSLSDYLKHKDESPLASRDLSLVIKELQTQWEATENLGFALCVDSLLWKGKKSMRGPFYIAEDTLKLLEKAYSSNKY
jgi:hypothetical protein